MCVRATQRSDCLHTLLSLCDGGYPHKCGCHFHAVDSLNISMWEHTLLHGALFKLGACWHVLSLGS